MIHIVDFRMGNLRSVQKAFERIGIPAKITADPEEVIKAGKLILPGVGHFSRAMEILQSTGLSDVLIQAVRVQKTPILGICLGMQLLTNCSQEGDVPGLGLVDAETIRFADLAGLKIPHMGWNTVRLQKSSLLYDGLSEQDPFYFVHSYYVTCKDSQDRLFVTTYGNCFDAGFQKDHIAGVQFHPEKSHQPGLRLLKNFAAM
jgi:imidazole glycerol-phosphate synthase subunit HisH